jgi:transposase-like protein
MGRSPREGGQRQQLVAGRDYPGTYRGFGKMFPDDEACLAYLEALRWRSGFACSRCGTCEVPWHQTRGRLVCRSCRYQASVTAGTILEKTRTPVLTWLEAAWHVTTAKNGLSAKTLERTLGTSYRVAWMLLQRFRVAMVRAEREQLSGDIEVDETYVGGIDHGGKCGRGSSKCVVVMAVEVLQPRGFGRIRMRHTANASSASLLPFVSDVVAEGSVVITDAWVGYNGLEKLGYTHDRISLSESGQQAHVVLPGVHRVASLLKRWILGTHQGSIGSAHLQAYLEEFTFRFNRRTSRSRGLVFRRLLEQMVATPPITEADVAHGYDWRNHNM